eukprot:s3918_g12.t1
MPTSLQQASRSEQTGQKSEYETWLYQDVAALSKLVSLSTSQGLKVRSASCFDRTAVVTSLQTATDTHEPWTTPTGCGKAADHEIGGADSSVKRQDVLCSQQGYSSQAASLGVRCHRTVVVRLACCTEKSRPHFCCRGWGDVGDSRDAETNRCFFVVQYLLDIGVIAWENLIHAGCNDIPASLASNAAHPFACGVERVVWLAFLVMAILIEGYFLFILQSYCQDVVVHLPTKAFGDLYEKSEAHILKKHLNPYSHLYGALPGHSELAGEAVMAGVSLHDSYTIFGENHDMNSRKQVAQGRRSDLKEASEFCQKHSVDPASGRLRRRNETGAPSTAE